MLKAVFKDNCITKVLIFVILEVFENMHSDVAASVLLWCRIEYRKLHFSVIIIGKNYVNIMFL